MLSCHFPGLWCGSACRRSELVEKGFEDGDEHGNVRVHHRPDANVVDVVVAVDDDVPRGDDGADVGDAPSGHGVVAADTPECLADDLELPFDSGLPDPVREVVVKVETVGDRPRLLRRLQRIPKCAGVSDRIHVQGGVEHGSGEVRVAHGAHVKKVDRSADDLLQLVAESEQGREGALGLWRVVDEEVYVAVLGVEPIGQRRAEHAQARDAVRLARARDRLSVEQRRGDHHPSVSSALLTG